ncbi:MAG TPA: MFS transporter [Gemmatimonadales bacterium]|nr:MFS transporter [Gemmatimonadales bacterium]
MPSWLEPKPQLTEHDLDHGIRLLTLDGVCSQAMGTLVGGAFLVAFALQAGASNAVIGALAAVGPVSQLAQLPAIAIINRLRRRKAVAVATALASRLTWLLIALSPWLLPRSWWVPTLLAGLVVASILGTVSGAAFNSWMRDFVPEARMGVIVGRRLGIATAASAAVGLAAGLAVDRLTDARPRPIEPYAAVLLAGAAIGLAGLWFLGRVPEPAMHPPPARPLRDILLQPLRDRNYRNLIRFLGVWNFAVNLAAPFFVVYMLRRLGFTMGVVIALPVLSQGVNALALRAWGTVADRFGNKSVLDVAGGLFLLSILLWPFAGVRPGAGHVLALAAAIHVLAGLSTAGVTLCAGNIALKFAPRGEATAYLATNAIWSGAMAALAPLAAGAAADRLVTQQVQLNIRWISTAGGPGSLTLTPIDLRGLDFLFLLAFLVGLYAMHRLLAVREAGEETSERAVVLAFYAEVRRGLQHVSNVPGLRQLTEFPFAILANVFPERRRRRRRRHEDAPAGDGHPRPAEARSS